MLRWLMITLLVLGVFLLILLALGLLLTKNEQDTRALIEQLAIDNAQQLVLPQEQSSVTLPADTPPQINGTAQRQQEIISKNLTCVDNKQCQLIRLSLNPCPIAINLIGAQLIKKYNRVNESFSSANCSDSNNVIEAVCINNLCEIK
ncbi:hypothetical protein [Thalassotalea piscium]|uniref:Putative membrane protein n=1 Tax=Thalassotalea piscium TaxID=1230533 RepID=A0A7X0NHW7_9GAMM|nr:hypothetical protein [Thalassotalea piscium]MBB6543683.1 putative membrane protein [Thalassotalea piscium]